MRQLVGDEALGVGVQVVGAEDGEPLGFEGDLEGVGGDDDRAVVLRVGPEGLLEEREHPREVAEGLASPRHASAGGCTSRAGPSSRSVYRPMCTAAR